MPPIYLSDVMVEKEVDMENSAEKGEEGGGEQENPPYKEEATAQGQGSGITYARRYGLAAICCLGADDDDGNEASGLNVSTQTTTTPPKENAPLPPPIGQVLSDDPGSFKITFGKHKDKTLAMMGVVAVSGYIKWLSEQPKISDAARELIKQGKEFLKKPSTSKEYCDELDEALKSSPPHDQWKDEPWPDAPPF